MTCPFITFYSFRGGTGCSTTVMMVGKTLAAAGSRVLILDMNLSCPGLTALAEDRPGVVDLLLDAVKHDENSDFFQTPPAFEKYLAPLPSDGSGTLHLMAVGQRIAQATDGQRSGLPARLHELDIAGLYQDGYGLALMKILKEEVQKTGRFDYVLVDSGNGHSSEAGICLRDLADRIFVLSAIDKMSMYWTREFLANLRVSPVGNIVDVVLSLIPQGDKQAQIDDILASFNQTWGFPLLEFRVPFREEIAQEGFPSAYLAFFLGGGYQGIVDRIREF